MIFNTWDYYLLFLIPSAIVCRAASPLLRPWVIFASGGLFFTYFSYTQFGGVAGAACLAIFLWESLVSRFYRPSSWICWFGVTQTVLFLALFKYRNFLTGLYWRDPAHNPLYWRNAFLPLGISFFTFEFVHYAVDRYRNRTEEGSVTEYLAFILFFPTMVAGPIKRYQDFLPKLRSISREWVVDWQRGVTRILTGLVKKFAVADVLTAYTSHLNWTDISRAHRHRLRAPVRDSRAGEFRLALSPHEHHRFLAALAHVAYELADRLHLHSAGRLAGGRRASLCEYSGHHAGKWHLARRRDPFHRLGIAARDPARDPARMAPDSSHAGEAAPLVSAGLVAIDLRRREPGLGLFLHGRTYRPFLSQEASRWIMP
jgi:hypothetical protein